MVRNDLYYGRPAYLDEIIWKVMPDAETVKLALQTGEVTYWQYPSGNDFEFFDTIPHLKYTYFPATRLVGFQFNANASAIEKWPWLGDVNVRRAFAHAVDTQGIIDQAWGGVAYEGHTWVPVGYTGFFNEEANARYPEFDPAEAERLLDEAGYPRGSDGWRDIEFDYLGDGDLAELLKYYWGEVGIKATVWAVEYATSVQKYMYGGYGDEVAVGGLGTGMGPDGDITVNLYSNRSIGNINSVYYNNPRVDEILDELSETVDYDARAALIYEMQDLTMDDFQTVILLTDTRRWVWNDELFGGYMDHPKPVYVIEPFGYYGFSRTGDPIVTATPTPTATQTGTTTVTVTTTQTGAGSTTTVTETITDTAGGGMATSTVGLIAIVAIALGAGASYFLTRPK
jgi:peptide/nickel transport system substrate-binding protein